MFAGAIDEGRRNGEGRKKAQRQKGIKGGSQGKDNNAMNQVMTTNL